jgi:hypothetical protein
MTPIHYVARELEATLGSFVAAVKSAGEPFLPLAVALVLTGLLAAAFTARFSREQRRRLHSPLAAAHRHVRGRAPLRLL